MFRNQPDGRNRPDCTGVHGIGPRSFLPPADMGKFKDPGIKPVKGEFPCPVKVTVEDASPLPGFLPCGWCAAVRNGPSPEMAAKSA